MDGEQTTFSTTQPVDLRGTTAPLRHGHRDPAHLVTPDGAVWRATHGASGPATLRLRQLGPTQVHATAWGPGAVEALERVPGLVGDLDDVSGFDPPPGPVRDAYRRSSTVRLTRTGRVLESLVPAVLEQRVITRTAHEAWRYLLLRHGAPAPGPAAEAMRVPPTPERWADVPVWDFHLAGVDPRRARTVVTAARLAHRLEEAAALGPAEASRRLQLVPGVGQWTAAEALQRILGDPDALPLGDFHLPGQVGWALTGRRTDDAGMLALLAPYRPHRWRAVRHLLLTGMARVPRRGPRLSVEDHRWR